MEQLMLPDVLPEGYLPCANPHLVEGYVSIEWIFAGDSVDFYHCHEHSTSFCDCNLDEKREDLSYQVLVKHFRAGGSINQPVEYMPSECDCGGCSEYGEMGNGHHRLIAAYDAGFTHVPYNSREWGKTDWYDTPEAEGKDLYW